MNLPLGSSARVKMGHFIIYLSALVSTIGWLDGAAKFDFQGIGRDNISIYERQFQDLRKMLPSHGTVGYITDEKAAGKQNPEEIRASERFILTQYVLTPLIVLDTPNCRLVVATFQGADFISSLTGRKHFEVLVNYGLMDNRGVVLLSNMDVR